jgi:hypothetical protein
MLGSLDMATTDRHTERDNEWDVNNVLAAK